MKIDSISCNNKFTGRNIKTASTLNKFSQINTKTAPKSNAYDSILLYFAGLLSAFGFDKPLNKLISNLR